jgi:predicted secreted protein
MHALIAASLYIALQVDAAVAALADTDPLAAVAAGNADPHEHRHVIETTVMSIVLITCFGMGGGTVSMLDYLQIPYGEQTVEPTETEKAKLAAQYSIKVRVWVKEVGEGGG